MIGSRHCRTKHFPSPAKSFENDISPAAYQRFEKCVAGLDAGSLERAYWYGWQWGKELLVKLKAQQGLLLPETLLEKIDLRMISWFQPFIREE